MIKVIKNIATEEDIEKHVKFSKEKFEHTKFIVQDLETKLLVEKVIKKNRSTILFEVSVEKDFSKCPIVDPIRKLNRGEAKRYFDNYDEGKHDFIVLDKNMKTLALAGTGKTTSCALSTVDKLVRGKCTIEEICLITFTNTAANELKERINGLLIQYREIGSNENIDRAINNINKCKIYTIDSFFKKLLTETGKDIGISRNFTLYKEDAEVKKIISEVVDTKIEYYDSLNSDKNVFDGLKFYAKHFSSLFEGILKKSTFNYYEVYEEIERNPDIKLIKYIETFKDIESTGNEELTNAVNKMLIDCIINVVEMVEKRRKKEGRIPLKSLTYYLKKTLPEFKHAPTIKKIKYLYLDESQDTSDEQYEVLDNIKKVNPDCKFIFVGDISQKIYNFRIGNTQSFEELDEFYQLTFENNYRSEKLILNYANVIANALYERYSKDIVKDYPVSRINLRSPLEYTAGAVKIIPLRYKKKFNNDDELDIIDRNKKSNIYDKDNESNIFNIIKEAYGKIREEYNNCPPAEREKKDFRIFILGRTNDIVNDLYYSIKDNEEIKQLGVSLMNPKVGTLFASDPALDVLALLDFYTDTHRNDLAKALNLIASGFGKFNQEITTDMLINMKINDPDKILQLARMIIGRMEEELNHDENVITNILNLVEKLPNKRSESIAYKKNMILFLNSLVVLGSKRCVDYSDIINFIRNKTKSLDNKTIDEANLNADIILMTEHASKGLQANTVIGLVDISALIKEKRLYHNPKKKKAEAKYSQEIIYANGKVEFSVEKIDEENNYTWIRTSDFDEKYKEKLKADLLEEINLIYITMTRAKQRLYLYVNSSSKGNFGYTILKAAKKLYAEKRWVRQNV